MDFLDTLNPQQKEAVLHTDGPSLILAGAGSGKTRVIICRIAHLIRAKGVPPHAILAVTFTNKAAEEMRNRVAALLRQSGSAPSSLPIVSTFHSFCVRLLRGHGAPLADLRPGFTASFSVYDEKDQLAVVKAVYRELGLDEKFMKARAVLSVISHGKNRGRSAQDFYREAASPQEEKLAVIFDHYQQRLVASNALDFDDLLLEAVRLLKHSRQVSDWANDRFHYLLVDEYQDTNRAQYELMRLLTAKRQNVCVVGDEDQSIYSWRGADIRNILDFERDYPGASVIRLEQNYRSTQTILRAAGGVVAHNTERKGKKLWTEGQQGNSVIFFAGMDGDDEARFVAGYIGRYLDQEPGGQAAILYRTNAQSRLMEEALRRCGREYLVIGGVSFYQRAEVKDLIAYLRAALSSADSVSLLRIINTPARGIGRTTVEQIETYARREQLALPQAIGRLLEQKALGPRAHSALTKFQALLDRIREKVARAPVQEALIFVYEESGYRRMLEEDPSIEAAGRRENIHELINAAADAAARGEDVHAFLDHAALIADTDRIDERAKILLMTLHSAKGLEFPLVAMIGLEEGLFPLSRSLEQEQALEEERRLCYVGMTRAKAQLLLSCARRRRRWGGSLPEPMLPSRFLSEVPPELLEDRSVGDSPGWQNAAWETQDVDLLGEQRAVRQMAEKRLYEGQTYNTADQIAGFFAKRGIPVPPGVTPPAGSPRVPAGSPNSSAGQPLPGRARRRSGFRAGSKVRHAKFGLGTVMRLDGQGEDQKLTVHFQSHGLKKLMLRYADLRPA